ncbi:methylenetetrahydrofolate reductase C-terminal domain-containing protein [Desulfosediminicola sp.]|uniref:methylenetetrahydrofolate reductase C-terminal domain-containing protein n=1 Tax=Desulfosediminicola sp. TaxID=2886825 RepID=UPI003AF2348B
MIVANRKPFAEIKEMLEGYTKVLNVGCGTCVSVCLTGGEKEVEILNTELEMARRLDDNPIDIHGHTIERQCDREYLAELDEKIAEGEFDALMSMACGVGIQFLAERYPDIPTFPAVDTSGLAVNQAVGWYEERCRSCSQCVLGFTGGICPITLCAKGLLNGPCGGTNMGNCEISNDQPCAWFRIYERLKGQDRLDAIKSINVTRGWKDQSPRDLLQPGYKKPESMAK